MNAPPANLWQNSQFRAYMFSTAFSGTAIAMQQLLLSWLLVGILLLPATQVGIVQALIGLPGLLLMLWGGASADSTDPRQLLMRIYAVAWLFPMALLGANELGWLNIWSVSAFGLAMSIVTSYSSPAQQAILNRVSGGQVQRAVTAATAMSFVVQIFGLSLAGQMEVVGISEVLVVQSISLILGVFAIRRILPLESPPPDRRESTIKVVMDGLKVAYNNPMVLQTLIITFTSGVFNAGAFMTALPFIVKRTYDGDALGLATIMIVFYAGATISNIIQYWVMPLARPGFWFLIMQATRSVIMVLVWIQPSWWMLMGVLFLWGLNMGVTTNLSRAIVQEAAEPKYLARLLSVYSLGMMGSMPVGALIIGYIIEAFGTMNAMVPAMVISTLLCFYGFAFTGMARYRSPGFEEKEL